MVQIINTIFIGLIVSHMLNKRDKYKKKQRLKHIIVTVWCVVYFLLFTGSSFLLTFGPGAFLVIYTYIDYGRTKQLLKKKSES